MSKPEFDVVIIGGGIAGLSLAIELASSGIGTAVIEKEKYPFHKVCGEYISMESFPYLQKLGLTFESLSLPRIRKLRVSSSGGTVLDHGLNPGGFGISRYLLDSLLCERARSLGATVLEGTRANSFLREGSGIIAESTSGPIKTRLLVGAHGKRSNIDRQLDRGFMSRPGKRESNYVAVKYHIRTDLEPDTIELHNFSGGYCGVSAVESGIYCLCYLTHARNLQDSGGKIADMEKKVLMKNPLLRKHLEGSEKLYDQPLVISQVSFAAKSSCEKNLAMTGDSAGLITPVCGNGMSMALRSSKLLSGYVKSCIWGTITQEEMEKQYSASWKALFHNRLRAGRMIQGLMGKEYITEMALKTLRLSPYLTRRLVSLTHGEEF